MRYRVQVRDQFGVWMTVGYGDYPWLQVPRTILHDGRTAKWERSEVDFVHTNEMIQVYRIPDEPERIEPVGQLFAVPSDVQRIADKVDELVAAVNRLGAR